LTEEALVLAIELTRALIELHRLEENLGAANVDLTPEDLRDVENTSSNIKVEGARYPQWAEQTTGR
jgi:hypothetical protein